MESEIARLLNCNEHDKKKLMELWDEYLLESDDEDKSSDTGDANDNLSSDEEEFNMQSNGLDFVIEDAGFATNSDDINIDLDKAKNFRLTSSLFCNSKFIHAVFLIFTKNSNYL